MRKKHCLNISGNVLCIVLKRARSSYKTSEAPASAKPKKLRGANRTKTVIDFIKHQTNIDISDAANRKYGITRGNINVPEKLAHELQVNGMNKYFNFEYNGGLGYLITPKDEKILVEHAEKMKAKK